MSNELHEYNINQCLINISDHIIESEMEGIIDKEDSYYPTLLALSDLIEKITDEEETVDSTKSAGERGEEEELDKDHNIYTPTKIKPFVHDYNKEDEYYDTMSETTRKGEKEKKKITYI